MAATASEERIWSNRRRGEPVEQLREGGVYYHPGLDQQIWVKRIHWQTEEHVALDGQAMTNCGHGRYLYAVSFIRNYRDITAEPGTYQHIPLETGDPEGTDAAGDTAGD